MSNLFPATTLSMAGEEPATCAKSNETTIDVYARWAGYAKARATPEVYLEERAHIYSASIPPSAPLKLGSRIRILATTPARYLSPEEDPDVYDAYEAHVVGWISRVVGWRGRKVVLEVENECAVNSVKRVRLRLPFAPEVTVQMEPTSVPDGRHEAQETDLYTSAVVRVPAEHPRCGAGSCRLPWRSLAGENFLWEPMVEEVGERPGATGGRRKMPITYVSWGDAK